VIYIRLLIYLLTYLLTHSLTHSMVKLIKKYPAFFMEPEGSSCSKKALHWIHTLLKSC